VARVYVYVSAFFGCMMGGAALSLRVLSTCCINWADCRSNSNACAANRRLCAGSDVVSISAINSLAACRKRATVAAGDSLSFDIELSGRKLVAFICSVQMVHRDR